MSDHVKRVRMMAGPNGSGKSTIKDTIDPRYLTHYINPDEIEKEIRSTQLCDLAEHGVQSSTTEIQTFLNASGLTLKGGLQRQIPLVAVSNGKIDLSHVERDGYWATIISEFLREKLLEMGESFTFETVMSHKSKVEFLHRAQKMGYRTYLYYVATSSPEINVERVKIRVKNKGHNVPEVKIRKRYQESLDLLPDAIRAANRAYIFDNSKEEGQHFLIAEFEDGVLQDTVLDEVPGWFDKAVLQKAQKS